MKQKDASYSFIRDFTSGKHMDNLTAGFVQLAYVTSETRLVIKLHVRGP